MGAPAPRADDPIDISKEARDALASPRCQRGFRRDPALRTRQAAQSRRPRTMV